MKRLLEGEFLIWFNYSLISFQELIVCQINEKVENIEVTIELVKKETTEDITMEYGLTSKINLIKDLPAMMDVTMNLTDHIESNPAKDR